MIRNSEGVSSVIGAVLMISLVVVAVGIISAMLLSQPTAEEIPELSVIAGVNPTAGKFTIFHEGGDPLALGTFSLMLDSGSGYEDKTNDFTLLGGGNIWSIGEYMTYDYVGGDPPVGLRIIYNGKSGDMLLTSVPIAYSGNVTYISGDTEIGGGVEYIPVSDIPEYYAQNTSSTSLMYYLGEGNPVFFGGTYLEFTITDTPSAFTVNDMVPRELNPGDTLKITLRNEGWGNVYINGLGNMIYTLRINNVWVELNGELVTYQVGYWQQYADVVYHAYFSGYDLETFDSTLTAQVWQNNRYEVYRMNNTVINEGYTRDIFHIFHNIRPSETGAFIVSGLGSNDGFDFVGMAEVEDSPW